MSTSDHAPTAATPPSSHDQAQPASGWDERQQRMLLAMGLRLWTPPTVQARDSPAAVRTEPARPAPARPVPAPAMAPVPTTPPRVVPGPLHQPAAVPAAGQPRPDLAGMDWDALALAVRDCRACALCDSRRQTVFGTGHREAAWLIVGEAPGAEEDARGEPFVGSSGQLLDAMLAALGLSREAVGPPTQRVYIANTLKCRPPSNRNPQPSELQQCLPYLHRQIELLRPRIVLAMGRFAAQAVLGSSEPIGQLRGRVHQAAAGQVVVTYHPSYLLRSPAEKAKAWADLCLAAAAAAR